MGIPLQTTASTASGVLRREVARFIAAARQRSEYDPRRSRRARRRYHRSWPLLVCPGDPTLNEDICVALHDASESGVGFLSHAAIPPGTVVFIKFFWHDDNAPRVPAIIRHATSQEGGYLNGCEFLLEDETACRQALDLAPGWYG